MCVVVYQVGMPIGLQGWRQVQDDYPSEDHSIAATLPVPLSKSAHVNALRTSDDEQAKTIIAASVCKWVAKFTSHIVASTMF